MAGFIRAFLIVSTSIFASSRLIICPSFSGWLNSIFSSITSTGGGGGNRDIPSHVAYNGGSGGGGQNPACAGGLGNTPPENHSAGGLCLKGC